LQTPALPLGYAALMLMERETGLEPATFSLARRRSTTELLPQPDLLYLGFSLERRAVSRTLVPRVGVEPTCRFRGTTF